MPLGTVPPHISTKFRAPEELLKNKDVVVSQLYQWHAKENPNYPLFVYHDGEQLEYITYAKANRAMDRAARYIASNTGVKGTNADGPQRVVAVLANADSVTYCCTAVGIMRAGCTIFHISTRNAPAAVADMLKRTGAGHLVVSPDSVMQGIAKEALSELALAGKRVVQLKLPTFQELFSEHLDPSSAFEARVQLPTSYDADAVSSILHSSGSTGHPKTVGWTYKRLVHWGKSATYCEQDIQGAVMGCQGTPMFHALGSFMTSAAPCSGFVLAVFQPASPPAVPTPDGVWDSIVETRTDFSWTVPSFIEEWSRDPMKVAHMQKIRGLMFGGAGLNEEVGDSLASKGVSLWSEYGCSEAGQINAFGRPNPGMDYAYWAVSKGVEVLFRPYDTGIYEVVLLSLPDMPLPGTNTKVGDLAACATNDLVVPHPTKPGLWKLIGRADEQIILSNGEKTNPVPLERILNDDPHIKSSVMFGRGKFQNGVLIEPTEDFAFDPNDIKKLEAFRNKIWPTVERANDYAPQHSRIFKEMILVASPSKPFQFTVKRQPRRHFILQQYHDEIERLYKEVESSAQSELQPPANWDPEGTLVFVRAVVTNTLRRNVADDADIFRSGGDSLQATWIRNTILRAVRETDRNAAKRLPMNLVFAAPSITSLTSVVYSALHEGDASARKPEHLWKWVEKYSADFPARPAGLVERREGKDVVLITGTTGGFGCDTLEHLLRDPSVGKVYAFNRKNAQAMERQRAQFRARGLDEALLDSPKFTMVEAVLHEPGFGLEPGLLDEVRRSVTHIMHNAWKVNFNLSIASFDVDIKGARNFVDFALSSPYTKPPAIIFVSSIGIFENCALAPPIPEVSMNDPSFPFGIGYPEAKWVTEHVLENATKQTGLHTVSMRLGQIAGDRLGYWNEKEWFPSLVKSAMFQHCLPDLEGTVAWFSAYEAAKAFAEMRNSQEPFLHLIHPHPTRWHALMEPIARVLKVPLVSYQTWLSALEHSVEAGSVEEVEAMKRNPALRLLPFFKTQLKNLAPGREPMGFVHLSTENAAKVSKAFTEMPELDAQRALHWVVAWKKSGFLEY